MTDAPTITVQLNGESTEIPQGLTVLALLAHLSIAPTGVAIERNRAVVRRVDHAQVVVEAGDELEIVQFVGGG